MSIRRHFLILDHHDTNILGESEFGDSVIFIPGELEDSTLGIWAAGDHIDVLEKVFSLFCLQTSTFFFCFQRDCIQQLPRVWSDLQTPTMAGNFQCCTHHETNLAVRHEGDTRVLGSTICDYHHYVLLGCSVHQHQKYLWVLDSSNGPGGKNQLLPGLLQVDDVDTIGLLLEDVLLHRGLAIVRPDVGGGSQHLGNVILLGRETE